MFNPTAPSSGYAQITALYVDKENMLLNTSLIVLSNAQTQINTQDRNWQSFQSGWDFACQVEMLVIYTFLNGGLVIFLTPPTSSRGRII